MRTPVPWLRVFIEGVVIVGSILLAFGIDSWWDRVQVAEVERQQISALADDFAQNLVLLSARQERLQRSERLVTALRDTLRARPHGSTVTVPDSLLAELRYIGTIDPVLGTLEAMIGSGRLDQLPDTALRSALGDWQRLVSDVRTNQIAGQDYFMLELIPFLATQGDFSHTLDVRAARGESSVRVSEGLIMTCPQVRYHSLC